MRYYIIEIIAIKLTLKTGFGHRIQQEELKKENKSCTQSTVQHDTNTMNIPHNLTYSTCAKYPNLNMPYVNELYPAHSVPVWRFLSWCFAWESLDSLCVPELISMGGKSVVLGAIQFRNWNIHTDSLLGEAASAISYCLLRTHTHTHTHRRAHTHRHTITDTH